MPQVYRSGMEGEGVFELVSGPFDEYPGDGLRLVLTGEAGALRLKARAQAGDGPTTALLGLLGLKDLQAGDEVFVHAKLLTRVVIRREPV